MTAPAIPTTQHITPQESLQPSERVPPARHALTIQAVPADAHIQIANTAAPYRPGVLLQPGPYAITVSRDGYRTHNLRITLQNADLRVAVTLKKHRTRLSSRTAKRYPSMEACTLADRYDLPLPRRHVLTVQSTPKDARVRIMNIKPRYRHGMSLPPGVYHFSVSREAYRSKQCWAEIVDRDLDLDIPLEPVAPELLSALTVRTYPPDAQVRLLNSRLPYRPGIRLMQGFYRVEVSKKGYQTEQRSVELSQEETTLEVVLTEQAWHTRSTLTVVPVMKTAQIRILNADVPYQPGVPLAPGRYHVEISKPGFKTARRWVTLSEKNLKVEIEMEDEDTDTGWP